MTIDYLHQPLRLRLKLPLEFEDFKFVGKCQKKACQLDKTVEIDQHLVITNTEHLRNIRFGGKLLKYHIFCSSDRVELAPN